MCCTSRSTSRSWHYVHCYTRSCTVCIYMMPVVDACIDISRFSRCRLRLSSQPSCWESTTVPVSASAFAFVRVVVFSLAASTSSGRTKLSAIVPRINDTLNFCKHLCLSLRSSFLPGSFDLFWGGPVVGMSEDSVEPQEAMARCYCVYDCSNTL